MLVPLSFLALPMSFLFLLSQKPTAAACEQLPWPYNLPPHVKYYPEDELMIKRDIEILGRLQSQPANGIRKMSADPNEKFYLDYWTFDNEEQKINTTYVNSSMFQDFSAPILLHSAKFNELPPVLRRFFRMSVSRRGVFDKRDFACPAGTQSCASINRPDTCCPSSTTCQIVPDSGLGDVGCCEASEICAGSLSTCPSGYSSCPNNPGGGCCLPGYACYEEGCVLTSTTVIVVTPTSSTISSSTVVPSTVTATSIVVVTPSTSTISTIGIISTISAASPTSVSTESSSPASTSSITNTPPAIVTTTIATTSTLASTLVCSTGFRSCPASLGGGCCPTDRACGSDVCPALTSSATAAPPVRPTTVTTSGTTSVTTSSIIGCPTGFYACSAYYQGGCCQVGRNCAQTSCPASASTTVISSNGITAVVPTGTYLSGQTTLLTGSCATGWSSCDATLGGGCCPSGYACGTAACSATASGGQGSEVGKLAPNGSSKMILFHPQAILFAIFSISLVAMIA